jgi:hypothetical protein
LDTKQPGHRKWAVSLAAHNPHDSGGVALDAKVPGEMLKTAVVDGDGPLRAKAERFIRETYASRYGARLDLFPSRLLVVIDARDEILCAAGLRFEADRFFSESYLDIPIEDALGALSHRLIRRSEIFEVTTLASRAPRATATFIESIGVFGESNGFTWSFFTLTRRLHRLVERSGRALIHLADADYRRIPDHEKWGAYYASDPKVFAIARPGRRFGCQDRQDTGRHAEAV